MSLSDRLRAARGDAFTPDTAPGVPATAPAITPARETPIAPAQSGGSVPSRAIPATTPPQTIRVTQPDSPVPSALPEPDALIALKERASAALFERVGARLNNPSLTEDQLHALVRTELNKVVEDETVPLTAEQRLRLISDIQDDVLGHGPLERLLADPTVTEIMVNGPDMIYVEQRGRLTRSSARFTSEEHLRQVIERIVSRIGRRIDESSPLVDARLADGSRVNAVIPPLAVNGSSLTIRKFSKDPFKVNDLIGFGTLTPEMAELLRACVQARLNIIVSGGTGSGKTTLLNVLSSFIPESERIVTIEDAVELQMQQDHVVRLEARPANIEGKGEISIRDLVRNSLRMRPDRIVVGEVRGGETLDMLQAMNTGHDGSLSTVHANSPRDAVARLETLVLMAGMDLPLRAIREQIASAVDVIIQLTRLRDGTRRVTAVTEVQGMEGQTVTLQDAFLFDYSAGLGPDGKFLGKPISTGVRPRFTDQFREMGITLSPRVFDLPSPPGSSR
ncbi:CpaF family protein [Dietzia cercidiphylli]|uniref:CpaF family protein n=1 Tax=Dietzia cercidiphylli TaxID=498199 RepID=UPI00223AE791|nr:ATPase, T2SS/T4P/T4SS family [Dietzia cercidiphylli]MCT1515167.1 Flp pilus assembly complex ATPase component TadA [Dietzia cercidiphylli]